MFKKILNVLSGDSNEKELTRLQIAVDEINAIETDFQGLDKEGLREKTAQFKARLANGEDLDDILIEAFATVRQASVLALGMRHYDVQLIGGIVLHEGKIAEMKTGEGKTLVATLPAYLNALTGEGVHVVTVNDYLAKRDAQWMGAVYHMLDLSVGCVQHEGHCFIYDPNCESDDEAWPYLRPATSKEAYDADITYGTNNEFGFDYLRDNMVSQKSLKCQRGFSYAIVDEVDNILIDEARTPLIISGQASDTQVPYIKAEQAASRLEKGLSENEFDQMKKQLGDDDAQEKADSEYDFLYDEKTRNIFPTARGHRKIASVYNDPDMYGESGRDEEASVDEMNERMKNIHHVESALRAKQFYQEGREYIVEPTGENQLGVTIVDEFTGRKMPGRRFSEGLHQAIEAKEAVKYGLKRLPIQSESVTVASITFQNYFRMYDKLAGMTGTAVTEAEEFSKTYDLDVVVIPTNKSLIRIEHTDQIYKNEDAKFRAVVREIDENRTLGRPVLVGTCSVEKSERLSEMLTRNGITHNILNAKNHEKEAHIIAQAGREGAVTIATNMAGRGVDILLGGNPEVMARDQLRKQDIDFSAIPTAQWNDVLTILRTGDDPSGKYNEPWAAILTEKFRQCEEEKRRVLEASGLHIIGTERHEARRIDNQLRGRAGRQGDPGSSRFFVSTQDDIMRRFGGDRIAGIMERFGFDEDIPIEHSIVSKAIENTQVKVEAHHFDIRKRLLEYDEVLNTQREVIYGEREKLLDGADLKANIQDMVSSSITGIVRQTCPGNDPDDWDATALRRQIEGLIPWPEDIDSESIRQMSRGEVEDAIIRYAQSLYEQKEEETGPDEMRLLERLVMLRAIDTHWREHLTVLENMRQGIGLRAYAQRDPLVAYKTEAHARFGELQELIREDIVRTIYRVSLVKTQQSVAKKERKAALPVNKKIGRNSPCPCGSGKKYKKCCGAAG